MKNVSIIIFSIRYINDLEIEFSVIDIQKNFLYYDRKYLPILQNY